MVTFCLPFLVALDMETYPSISLNSAVSFGFRTSKSSATLGRPPVISFVLVVALGSFAITSPALTSSPSSTSKIASVGIKYRAIPNDPARLTVFPSLSLIEILGRSSPLLDSMMVRLDFPVTGSTFSCMVLPDMTSPNLTVPSTSEIMGVVKGSQVARRSPTLTLSPSFTSMWAP